MHKTAQKMEIWDKFREKTNIGGLVAENWFDPEFKKIMDDLRHKTDDPIRTIISGKSIGEYPSDGISCKDLLKSARSNFNRREYMKSIADLGRFHKKFYNVSKILDEFSVNLDAVHRRFLFDEVSPGSSGYNEEYAKYLHDIKTRFSESKKANIQYSFVKEAGIVGGILDFYKNIGTRRGAALAAWEKRYPGRIKSLKKALSHLLDQSDNLLKQTIFYLKTMGTARAKRQVDEYKQAGDKILNYYKIYDDIFKKFYNENLKILMDQQEFLAKVAPVEDSSELGKTDIGKPTEAPVVEEYQQSIYNYSPISEAPVLTGPDISLFQTPTEPSVPDLNVKPRGLVRPKSPPATSTQTPVSVPAPSSVIVDPNAPIPAITNPVLTPDKAEQIKQQMEKSNFEQGAQAIDEMIKNRPLAPPGRKAHIRFMESLESLSNESPIILAKIIMKYAKSIEKSDPLFNEQLINIVKSIKV